MIDSALVDCRILSPNHSGMRTKALCRITPHCVVGQLTAESIGGCFTNKNRQASCNYGIGTEGRTVLVVPEAYRSWCSSSKDNDQQAVTIECASDKTAPYSMNSKVYNKLIELCADICRRNGKKRLLWLGSKEKTLAYIPKIDEMVLTAHRWFANKSCPGDWLYSRYGELADKVNEMLGVKTIQVDITPDVNPFVEPTVNIKRGTKGEGAKWVQWCLWRFGLLEQSGIDGVIGLKSEAAIRTAQERLGLAVDGIVGKNTRQTFKLVL